MPDDDKKRALLRKQIDTCYTHALRIMGQEGYDFSYVSDLLSKCVNGDFSNWDYADKFLENLRKKYGNNGKGLGMQANLSGLAPRTAMKKAIGKKDWATAVKNGVELLKLNPWDSSAAALMASTAEGLATDATTQEEKRLYDHCELRWLRMALTSSPNDAAINRQCALALAKRNEFDQAIACWRRVDQAKRGDDEATSEISRLAVLKTRSHQTGYDESAKPGSGGAGPGKQEAELTPEHILRQKIRKEPDALPNYFELAQLYISAENYKRATEVLGEAMKVSHDDADVRERYEDARLRYLRQRLIQAEKKAKASSTEADAHEAKKIRYELAHGELENYKFLCERYPTNLTFRYELGERFRAVRDYSEAIKQFQSALSDPRKRGNCLLSLAICFQQIKKYPLAMTHYKQAVDEIPERELVTRKQALYLAGKLALYLKDREHAEKYLTALAQLEYGYKDLEALLDKVERLGNDNPSGAAPDA